MPPKGSLQRVVAHYPEILTLPVKTVKRAVLFLREKCLFTSQQVTDILRDSPATVVENLGQLEYKFQVSIKPHKTDPQECYTDLMIIIKKTQIMELMI